MYKKSNKNCLLHVFRKKNKYINFHKNILLFSIIYSIVKQRLCESVNKSVRDEVYALEIIN